ncbi:hypothetical protein [Nocardioides dongkuii]|uniref:hypothetical protein n=1 Tax=Nocardioides dongkuii TaxID=2760089 RepID=UPI0015FC192D|nr:hypothetical protein [Nocardioides dongkuii]
MAEADQKHDWESTFKTLAWVGFATILIGLFGFGSVPVMLVGGVILAVFGFLGYGT